MLAYIRVVVVWAVSPMGLPFSKHCAYSLPRTSLRVKLARRSLRTDRRETHAPRSPACQLDLIPDHSRPYHCRPVLLTRSKALRANYARRILRAQHPRCILVRIEFSAQSYAP